MATVVAEPTAPEPSEPEGFLFEGRSVFIVTGPCTFYVQNLTSEIIERPILENLPRLKPNEPWYNRHRPKAKR